MKREWKPGEVALIPGCGPRMMTVGGWAAITGEIIPAGEFLDPRPLVVIDPEDREAMERLLDAHNKASRDAACGGDDCGSGSCWIDIMRNALREFADPKPRCVAHGNVACEACSRIAAENINEHGECRSCSTYADTGMHWDTCPYRIRGRVFANRDEALS